MPAKKITPAKYIAQQPTPQKQICQQLRKIILKTFPDINEQIKLGVLWYDKYYIVSLKDSVNLGFAIKGLLKKDKDKFSGTGKTMRHLKFKDLKEINQKEIVRLLKLVDTKAKCVSCYK